MSVEFHDLQERINPLNGVAVKSWTSMRDILCAFAQRPPFLFELRATNGFMLTIGIAKDCGTAQYSPASGLPPYFMAVGSEADDDDDGSVNFLAGNTPTAIPRIYCMPTSLLHHVIQVFMETGERSASVSWKEI